MKSGYYAQRITSLRRELKARKLPAALITNVHNVTYLTGFTGDSSSLLVTPKAATLISDSRFTIQIQEECPGLNAEIRSTSKHTADGFIASIVELCRLATTRKFAPVEVRLCFPDNGRGAAFLSHLGVSQIPMILGSYEEH